MQYIPAGEVDVTPKRVMILGLSGAGKTRLAGTFPEPLFIDIDRGAGTALAGGRAPNRIQLGTNVKTRERVQKIFKTLSAYTPDEDGLITHTMNDQDVKVGSVVLDTLSALQEAVRTYEVLRNKHIMSWDEYDLLLSLMQKTVVSWNDLPVPLVVCCHSKKRDVEGERYDEVKPNLDGSIRDRLKKWFDFILHIMVGQGGARFVVTESVPINGAVYVAKDRHNILGRLHTSDKLPVIQLSDDNGYPDSTIADAILAGFGGHVSDREDQ